MLTQYILELAVQEHLQCSSMSGEESPFPPKYQCRWRTMVGTPGWYAARACQTVAVASIQNNGLFKIP